MSNCDTQNLKELVRKKYSDIATRSDEGQPTSCCGPSNACCSSGELQKKAAIRPPTGSTPNGDKLNQTGVQDAPVSLINESYDRLEGYLQDADLQLGCGIPVEFAGLKPGQSVLDLGSGAGNDVFVARSIVGSAGRITGLDFSEAMIRKAIRNIEKTGYDNIEFVHGDIENLPFNDGLFDVILSNCVLNLVPDKHKAFSEMYRVLKSGGHFCISDIVREGEIPEAIRAETEAYVGCISGASRKSEYLQTVENTGFTGVTIHKERAISLPESLHEKIPDTTEDLSARTDSYRVLSITLTGRKD